MVKARRHAPVFIVDLAVPRDVEPEAAELDDVFLYSVDDLSNIVKDNLQIRKEAVVQAEQMIATQAESFLRWLEGRTVVPTITALHGHHDQLRAAELERARRLLATARRPSRCWSSLARGLTNKFLHAPTQALNKAGDAERAELVALFERIYQIPDRALASPPPRRTGRRLLRAARAPPIVPSPVAAPACAARDRIAPIENRNRIRIDEASLHIKLDAARAPPDELDAMLSSEDATRDMDRYRALTRERAEIEPVVARFGDYRSAEGDLATADEMARDPQMKAFADEERAAAGARMDGARGRSAEDAAAEGPQRRAQRVPRNPRRHRRRRVGAVRRQPVAGCTRATPSATAGRSRSSRRRRPSSAATRR